MSFKSQDLFKQIEEGLKGMSEKEKKDIMKKVSLLSPPTTSFLRSNTATERRRRVLPEYAANSYRSRSRLPGPCSLSRAEEQAPGADRSCTLSCGCFCWHTRAIGFC